MQKRTTIGSSLALLSGMLSTGCLSYGPNQPAPMSQHRPAPGMQAQQWNPQYAPGYQRGMSPMVPPQAASPMMAPVAQNTGTPSGRLTTPNNLAAQQQAANRLLQGTTPNTALTTLATSSETGARKQEGASPQVTMVPVTESGKGNGVTMTVPLAVKVSVQPMPVEATPVAKETPTVSTRTTVPQVEKPAAEPAKP